MENNTKAPANAAADSHITCDIVRDLMPLTQDGVASEDSENAVQQHLAHCEACQKIYKEMRTAQPTADTEIGTAADKKILSFLRRRMILLSVLLLMVGAFAGIMFVDSELVFQNLLLMPVIGALAYLCFQWKGSVLAGAVLILTPLRGLLSGLDTDSVVGYLWFGVMMGQLVMVGMVIAALLAFAFRKEPKKKEGRENI